MPIRNRVSIDSAECGTLQRILPSPLAKRHVSESVLFGPYEGVRALILAEHRAIIETPMKNCRTVSTVPSGPRPEGLKTVPGVSVRRASCKDTGVALKVL
jgi:hypothetical protein